ncbi:hypothetical protein LZ32DRAFT_655162 [Colletotrichum eremochloae]|nr:hypothetical protein LZ32DRAFT_655162 [Colletotrichum eremochloae]
MSSSANISPTDACLGVDSGSTAVRVALAAENAKESEIVPNPKTLNSTNTSKCESGAFGAHISLSEGTKVYTGEDIPNATQVPAKLILSKGRGIDENNPLLAEFRRDKGPQGNARFERRCQKRLEANVAAWINVVKERCEKSDDPLNIKRIGLTIPAHWTIEEEEAYRTLIEKAFPKSRSRKTWLQYSISFMTEIEGFAHFFFHDPHRCKKYLGDEPDNFVLFLDFGGHSMNGCLYYSRQIRGKLAFYRVRDPFGAVGGSALWEAAVGDFCYKHAISKEGSKATDNSKVQSEFQKMFREEMRDQDYNPYDGIELRIKPPGKNTNFGDTWITIGAGQSRQFFFDAMHNPLKLAEKEIKALAPYEGLYENVGVKILVSGGTANSEAVQRELKGYCKAAGVSEPIFAHKKLGRSFAIAKGAAMAVARDMSFLEFIENGAAFGIQMLQGSNNPERKWDNVGRMLLADKGRGWRFGHPYQVNLSGTDRMKIICDPFWSSSGPKDLKLSCRKTYDVLDLLVPEAGTWEFSLSLREDERLVLKQSMIRQSGCEIRPYQETVFNMEFRQSLGCFLIKVNEDLGELDSGLGLDRDNNLVALTSELEKSLERQIQGRLAQRPTPRNSCVVAKRSVGVQQRKRPSNGVTKRPPSGRDKPQGHMKSIIRFPTPRRRPDNPQADSEQEEGIEFLNPVSDSESYHSMDTSRESSVSLGTFELRP